MWWTLTREQAAERARNHVEAQGLAWTEPVRVTRALFGGWNVMTNQGMRGGNIFLTVRRDGRIKGGTQATPR